MSYILQGSGAVLGPCLTHLLGRDLPRASRCICLKCSRIVAAVPDRGKSPLRRTLASQPPSVSPLAAAATNPTVMLRELGPVTASYRDRYPGPSFSESHFSSYNVPMSAQVAAPLNVNLTFNVGPGLATGVSYRYLHTSPLLDKKASSKIEETVIRLKEKQDEALADISKVQDLEKKIASVIEEEEMVCI